MRSSFTTRIISILLAIVLTISSLPFQQIHTALAAEEVKNTETIPSSSSEEPINPSAPELPEEKPYEVTTLRTENSKTTDNGDGTYTKEIYSKPIHTKEGKELKDISTEVEVEEIQDTEVVKAESTLIDFFFEPEMKKGFYATFKQNGHILSYSFLSARGNNIEKFIENQKIEAQYKENIINYNEILPSISLRNVIFSDSVKEDIILSKYTGLNTFTFQIETDLTAKLEESGEIIFTDKDGTGIYSIPKPFMVDSNINKESGEAQRSENVHFTLKKDVSGWIISVVADDEWLKSSERVYPVYIDPTTKIYETSDTYVSNAYPTTNYDASNAWDSNLGMYTLKVGNYDNTTGNNFAFLKQDVSKYQNANIDWAWLNVFTAHSYYPSTPTGVWLDKVNGSWAANSLTWNNKPSSTNLTSVNVYKGQWATFDIKNILQDWVSGKHTNNGFMLHTNGNGQTFWKKFVSSENTGNDKVPHINFSYSFPAPSNLTSKTYNLGDNTGYIDLNWNSVPGAIKYRVWIFDGKEYKPYDVGNRTSWSSKDKSVWPTAGLNLPEDPRPYYQASGGTTYNDRRNYAVTVSAIMSSGEESTLADPITPYIPMMKVPANFTGKSFSNGNKTGYVNLSWDTVPHATGYLVWIFDGTKYVHFNAGNSTNWSSKGKLLWPKSVGDPISINKTGTELPADPSPFYAGTRYEGSKNYWFRVSAYNTQGETNQSTTYMPTISPLSIPNTPTGYSVNYDNNKGAIDLEWDALEDALGYKVWIFNGHYYESVDVGNVTEWSTAEKGIWPTEEEINTGRYQLHLTDRGSELDVDPSLVYKNADTKYISNKNYWFRVSARDQFGETIMSDAYMPTISPDVEEPLVIPNDEIDTDGMVEQETSEIDINVTSEKTLDNLNKNSEEVYNEINSLKEFPEASDIFDQLKEINIEEDIVKKN